MANFLLPIALLCKGEQKKEEGGEEWEGFGFRLRRIAASQNA